MNGIEIIFLIVAAIGFFFCAFTLTHDDYLLTRRNISLETIFNTLFLVMFSSLLFGRIVYVLFHFTPRFLNPLVFFLFPYFPGLSLVGAITGGFLLAGGISLNSKIPTARFLDIVSLSFLCSYSIFYFPLSFSYLALIGHFQIVYACSLILYPALFLGALRVFLKAGLKDGSIAAIGIFFFSLLYSVFMFFDKTIDKKFFFESEGVFLFVLFVVSTVYLLRIEKIHTKLKPRRNK